jgi:hypothetical protein
MRDRLSLFVRRSCWCIGYIDDGVIRTLSTVIRPTALVLNVLVASIGSFNFGGPVTFSATLLLRLRCFQLS